MHIADSQYAASINITTPLQSLIINQTLQAPLPDVYSIKSQVHQDHCFYGAGFRDPVQTFLPISVSLRPE